MRFSLYVHGAGHVEALARNRLGQTIQYRGLWQDDRRAHQPIQCMTFVNEAARRTYSRFLRSIGYRKVTEIATGCERDASNLSVLTQLVNYVDHRRAGHSSGVHPLPLSSERAATAVLSELLNPAHLQYSRLALLTAPAPPSPYAF